MQVNDIHGTHGQTGTIDHATDIAVEGNIVELPCRSFSFAGIFLRWIAHGLQVFVTIQGVAIDTQLGIQAMHIAFSGDNQWVNFDQRQVFVDEQLRQTHENLGELTDLYAN